MTAEAAVMAGRAAAEALMIEACSIVRPGPGTAHTTDPTTGKVTYTGSSLYSGKCRVQMMTGTRGDALLQAAERAFAVQSAIISVPASVTGLRVGDVVTVTASALDGDLVGRAYRVEDLVHKTFATARRLICQEVTG